MSGTQRKCSFCYAYYTDEEGHDYEVCVVTCKERVERLERQLHDARNAVSKAGTVAYRRRNNIPQRVI